MDAIKNPASIFDKDNFIHINPVYIVIAERKNKIARARTLGRIIACSHSCVKPGVQNPPLSRNRLVLLATYTQRTKA